MRAKNWRLPVFLIGVGFACAILLYVFNRTESAEDLYLAIRWDRDETRTMALLSRGRWREKLYPSGAEEFWSKPVHVAASYGRPRLLRLILAQAGSDPNDRDYRGTTPLMDLCYGFEGENILRPKEYKSCFNELVHHGANVNAKSKDGQTALHISAGLGSSFLIELLLSAGANPNLQDKRGNTPLHEACLGYDESCGNAVASLLLLLAGADPSIKNHDSLTPLDIAVKRKREDIIAVFKRFDLFIEHIRGGRGSNETKGSEANGTK